MKLKDLKKKIEQEKKNNKKFVKKVVAKVNDQTDKISKNWKESVNKPFEFEEKDK